MARSQPEELPGFLPPTEAGVARAAALLKDGEIVALPTETVYGLAVNALEKNAVRKVFAAKGRPLLDPLIVHGLDAKFLANYAHFTPTALRLAEACWPGPLTLIVPKKRLVPKLVTAGRETVAVRAPAHSLMRAVLERCGLPLAAPSANPFGYISPTCAEHVRTSLGSRAPWILDGGPCMVGVESTIVDVSDPSVPPRILRPGPITAEALAHILGQPIGLPPASKPPPAKRTRNAGMPAPGLLPRHYSPHTPLEVLPPGVHPPSRRRLGREAWLRLHRSAEGVAPRGVEIFWLSENGNLADAAHALYARLRQLDNGGYQRIWCEAAPNTGFGVALNDRLRRAAGAVNTAKK